MSATLVGNRLILSLRPQTPKPDWVQVYWWTNSHWIVITKKLPPCKYQRYWWFVVYPEQTIAIIEINVVCCQTKQCRIHEIIYIYSCLHRDCFVEQGLGRNPPVQWWIVVQRFDYKHKTSANRCEHQSPASLASISLFGCLGLPSAPAFYVFSIASRKSP